jgi:hypothetical protein
LLNLRQVAVARASALSKVQQRTANPPKEFPAKQRSKKSKAAPAAQKGEEDVIELD